MKRHKPMRKRNPERLARLRAKQAGPQAALCRTLPCCACGAPPPSHPHHWPTRANGGEDRHTVPLCFECHDVFHVECGSASAFEQVWGVDIEDVARRLAEEVGGE